MTGWAELNFKIPLWRQFIFVSENGPNGANGVLVQLLKWPVVTPRCCFGFWGRTMRPSGNICGNIPLYPYMLNLDIQTIREDSYDLCRMLGS